MAPAYEYEPRSARCTVRLTGGAARSSHAGERRRRAA